MERSTSTGRDGGVAVRGIVLALLLAVAAQAEAGDAASGKLRVATIGILVDGRRAAGEDTGPLAGQVALLEGVVRETIRLAEREIDVRFPEDKRRAGEFTVDSIRAAADRLLADPEVDVVVSLGALSTHELAHRESLPKPVIGAWAVDVEAQGLPLAGDATSVHNLNYIVAQGSILADLRRFRDVAGFSTVHVLVDAAFEEAIPEIPARVTAAARSLGLELITVPVRADAGEALSKIPAGAQAVYVTPLVRMSGAEFDRLVAGLIERRLPSFSLLGEQEVERGILGGLRPRMDVPRLARRIALNTRRVLDGEDAGRLPVLIDREQRLFLNMATARAIGVHPPWRVLLEAVQLHPNPTEIGPLLTFDDAVREAVAGNLSLLALGRDVAAGEQDVRAARARLLPQVDGFLRGLRIDEDRAAASFGSQAERTVSGGISATQLLYSDAARAGLEISRSVQESREQDLEAARLDLALEAATAYLDVLRSETLERVARENLRLTESNLDLALRREEIGAAGPGDVYRWRAELANDRSDMIAAGNRTLEARVALNRLRHRPLEEPFRTAPAGVEDSWLITCCDRLRPYIDNPDAFARFREFTVRDGLAHSVELRSLDAAIAAAERERLAARRSYWAPTFGLRLDLERDFSRRGAGAAGPAIPQFPVAFEGPDRDDVSVAVEAKLPLWRGGARKAELRRTTEELAALGFQRAALVEGVETRIRLAMFEAGITFPAIELAQERAEAASQNLELVTDAYSKGAVSIINLLDAQNAAQSADEAAANAVFEFLGDLMEVERATNGFDFFRSDAAREAWLERLREFFEQGD